MLRAMVTTSASKAPRLGHPAGQRPEARLQQGQLTLHMGRPAPLTRRTFSSRIASRSTSSPSDTGDKDVGRGLGLIG